MTTTLCGLRTRTWRCKISITWAVQQKGPPPLATSLPQATNGGNCERKNSYREEVIRACPMESARCPARVVEPFSAVPWVRPVANRAHPCHTNLRDVLHVPEVLHGRHQRRARVGDVPIPALLHARAATPRLRHGCLRSGGQRSRTRRRCRRAERDPWPRSSP